MLVYVPFRTFIIKQNFKRTSPNLVWTLRLRSLWLYRNVSILIFLYQQLLLSKSPYLLLNKAVSDLHYLTQYVLIKKLYFILTHVYLKSYMIRVSNFARSCDYWTLQGGVNHLSDNNNSVQLLSVMQQRWYSLYIKPRSLIGLFMSKKLYKLELVGFILLLLHNWRSLNSVRFYHSGYPIVTKEWLLVPFFGNYYFKKLNF